MSFYVVIDTNVLVSVLLSSHNDVAPVQVVVKLFSKEVIPIFSEKILDEYNEVFRRKKFNFSENIVDILINVIKKIGEMIEPNSSGEIFADMKDFPFYKVVLDKKDEAAYLITGSMKHFPCRPFIVTAGEFLKILKKTEE